MSSVSGASTIPPSTLTPSPLATQVAGTRLLIRSQGPTGQTKSRSSNQRCYVPAQSHENCDREETGHPNIGSKSVKTVVTIYHGQYCCYCAHQDAPEATVTTREEITTSAAVCTTIVTGSESPKLACPYYMPPIPPSAAGSSGLSSQPGIPPPPPGPLHHSAVKLKAMNLVCRH